MLVVPVFVIFGTEICQRAIKLNMSLLVTALVLFARPPFCSGAKRNLTLLNMTPMTGNVWRGSTACLVPVQMAVEQINRRDDILSDYNLGFDLLDTECHTGRSVYRMTEVLHGSTNTGRYYPMILGPILSTIAMAAGEVSYNWNITQLAFAASSPALSNKKRFPRTFRIAPPDRNHNGMRIGVMKRFDWTKIATIHQATEFFSTVIDFFTQDALDANLTIIAQEVFLNDMTTQVQNLKNRDARIIMTAMYEDKARELLCEAYKAGLYGPKIVWFFMAYYAEHFWDEDSEVTCSAQQMRQVAEGAFLIASARRNPNEERGLANATYLEFMDDLLKYHAYDPSTSNYLRMSDNCYDAVWMAALVLNCTDTRLRNIGHPRTLDQFTYADHIIGDTLYDCMRTKTMMGVGGPVNFVMDGDPSRPAMVERVQDGERYLIGYHRNDIGPDVYQWFDENLRWRGGKVPRDSTVVKNQEIVLPAGLYYTMNMCAGLGIVLAIGFLTFNIIFRENRLVKMSSPNINNILLLGCLLCYISVFFNPIEVSAPSMCQTRVFCFCLGFTIAFGAMFSKTWRVYRIFTTNTLIRRTIRDRQLLAINGVLAGVALVILIVWQLFTPYEVTTLIMHKEIFYVGNDEEVRPYVRMCQSPNSFYVGWVIYIMEGSLLAFGAFLAWETRKVSIPALNDSHQIGLCLYNVVILSAVGLTLSLLLEDQQVLLYGVTSGCLVIGTTLTQMIVFVPKVHSLVTKVDTEEQTSSFRPSIKSRKQTNNTGPSCLEPGNKACPPGLEPTTCTITQSVD